MLRHGIVLVLKISLRIEGNEWEPAGLNLHHEAMSRQEIMVNIGHRKRHFEFLSVPCGNR